MNKQTLAIHFLRSKTIWSEGGEEGGKERGKEGGEEGGKEASKQAEKVGRQGREKGGYSDSLYRDQIYQHLS